MVLVRSDQRQQPLARRRQLVIVIASDSEAIQRSMRAALDCFVASLLAMTIPSLPGLIRQSMRRFSMDHRVKPGGDEELSCPTCCEL
jgi:hypothetical protein